MIHEIKIYHEYFTSVLNNKKRFEIRINDRDYKVGDIIVLKELEENRICFTGREFTGKITYITDFHQKDGYIVFGFEKYNIIKEN